MGCLPALCSGGYRVSEVGWAGTGAWSGASSQEGKVCVIEDQKVESQSGDGRAGPTHPLPPSTHPSLHHAGILG